MPTCGPLKYIDLYKTMPSFVLIAGGGGGPQGGRHYLEIIPMLNKLAAKFDVPTQWWLYDPLGFAAELENLKNTERIHLVKDRFTDEIAENWYEMTNGAKVLFLSDIRSVSIGKTHRAYTSDEQARKSNKFKLQEQIVHNNMQAQMRWLDKLHADLASVKFRAPYPVFTTDEWQKLYKSKAFKFWYLRGSLCGEPDNKANSAEMRLICCPNGRQTSSSRFAECEYDAKFIERKLSGFNNLRQNQQWDINREKEIDALLAKLNRKIEPHAHEVRQ